MHADDDRDPEVGPDHGARDGADELIEHVLPALIARLGASRLAELEVRSGDWRVRLRRDVHPERGHAAVAARSRAAAATGASVDADHGVARSPAVGYFAPGTRLAVGQAVQAGDMLGRVEVLGVLQDVISPHDGVISRVLVEPGQAVEYGQALALVDPLDGADLPGTLPAPGTSLEPSR